MSKGTPPAPRDGTLSTRTPSGLPRYVGEREILAATGMSRATLNRKRDAGEFPQPARMGRNVWRVDIVLEWMKGQERAQRAKLVQASVRDPAKLPLDDVPDALQQLGARIATAQGRQTTPDEIVGVTVKLNADERQAVARAAEQHWQLNAAKLADALEHLHIIEALILARAFLPPLRAVAENSLAQAGVPITMSDADWRDAGLLIIDRLLDGNYLPQDAVPRQAADALAADGVLSKK